jgi:N-acetyl sugar amidotransferase
MQCKKANFVRSMKIKKMQYCCKCVYPISAVNLSITEDGICSSCKVYEKFSNISEIEWKLRKEKFEAIINEIRKKNNSDYDCVIGVSGGKDSYYQTHIIAKEYGLKPLLVTYHGNNFLPEGDYNRDRMREVFNADHLIWGPSVDVLKKLNRLAFKKMGDMNWQNHCGIFTVPIIVAVKFKIPIVIWGEVPWDISGMYSPEDFVEFSARGRLEHGLRGYEYNDFINNSLLDKISEKDMSWAKYPTDKEILEANVRGLYIGNFFKWDPNQHVKLVENNYGWKRAQKPFQRTYRDFSNLDDRYENGIHDLLKFIKFGYGRCSDHVSKDIRSGYMTREEGIKLVKKYDHIVSDDLEYWLNYVNMKKEEFWSVANKFRDPNVWWVDNNKWYKDNIWGEPTSYGDIS